MLLVKAQAFAVLEFRPLLLLWQCFSQMSPARASHGAALVAPFVRFACVAKAPRRTVAAVAAAAVSAALQLDDAAVAPPMPVPEQTPALLAPTAARRTQFWFSSCVSVELSADGPSAPGGKLLRLRRHRL